MRHLVAASLLVCAFALPAAAQDEGPPVPVEKAAYHVPVFRNEYLTVLRVNIPSQRSAGYHIHSKVGVDGSNPFALSKLFCKSSKLTRGHVEQVPSCGLGEA